MSGPADLKPLGLWPIRSGMNDSQFNDGPIASVQTVLNAWMDTVGRSPHLTVDGDYGPATADAMRAYQSANGLQVTGQYDDATYANFQGTSGPPAASSLPWGWIAGGTAATAAVVAVGVAVVKHRRHS